MSEILLYTEVGEFGVTASDFIDKIKGAGANPIDLRINSPGGSVFDGYAIYNALKRHVPGVNVYVDGLAASIASYIAMAGTRVSMAKNSMLMIHNPMSLAGGDAAEMRKQANLLDEIKSSLTDAYSARTGIPCEEISKMLDEETWLDADQALAFGFIDEITPELAMAAKVTPEQLARFKHAPKNLVIEQPKTPMEDKTKPTDSTPAAKPSIFAIALATLKEKSSLIELNAKHLVEIEAKDKDILALNGRVADLMLKNAELQSQVDTYVSAESELKSAIETLETEKKTASDEAINIVASLGFDPNALPAPVSAEDADAARSAAEPKTADEWHAKYNAIKDPVEQTKFLRENSDKIWAARAAERRAAK